MKSKPQAHNRRAISRVGLVHAQSNPFDKISTIDLWPAGSHKHGEF